MMEALTNSFFYDGVVADDFYFVLDSRGKRRFYARRTGKVSALSRIPKDVIDSIKERPKIMAKSDLLKQRQELTKKMDKIKDLIASIDLKIVDGINYEEMEEEQKLEEERKKECIKRKAEQQAFIERILKNFIRDNENPKPKQDSDTNSNPKPKPKPKQVEDPIEFLKKHGITTKKEWHNWLLENHPDKGGKDIELCQNIISNGQLIYF